MDWLGENWGLLLLYVASTALHLFGRDHYGHGRHVHGQQGICKEPSG
jgi:hypothetical protein